MGGIVAAWMVGEGLLIYRAVKADHAPPIPGRLLASSMLFVLLGLLAESDSARPLAVALAWGFDIAAFMKVAPMITDASISRATAGAKGSSASATAQQATGVTVT